MPKYTVYITLLYLVFYSIISCKEKTEKSTHKPILLATETVLPFSHGHHDTLDYQLTISEDSTYSLSYKKTIPHPDYPNNKNHGLIITDHYKGIAKIKEDSIFLTNDTLLLINGYVEFMKNGKIDFVRKIDSTVFIQKNTYDIKKYPKYHVIHYETWTADFLRRKKEFKRLFKVNDETLFEIEWLVKDTVDKIMPKNTIYNDKPLMTPNEKGCCYFASYHKKVLPYIDQNGHKIIKLFLSLEAKDILGADLPMISDGAYYFLDIDLNLTNKKITRIGL